MRWQNDDQPPLCFREAKFDEDGVLDTSNADEMFTQALLRSELNPAYGWHLLAPFLKPTTACPDGKDALTRFRVAYATGELPQTKFRAAKIAHDMPLDVERLLLDLSAAVNGSADCTEIEPAHRPHRVRRTAHVREGVPRPG